MNKIDNIIRCKQAKLLVLLPLCLLAFLLLPASCGSEDDLTPSNAEQNLYAPADGDNSQLATLKRDFYNNVGSYLLFSDTLGVDERGKTVILDMLFNFVGSNSSYDTYKYTYDYITDYATQKKAADMLRQKFTYRLGKGVPYCFFLVNNVTMWEKDDSGQWTKVRRKTSTKEPHPQLIINDRCYCISMGDGEAYDDDDYFKSMFATVVQNVINKIDESDLTEFYSYSADYYDKSEAGYDGVTDDYWDPDPDEAMWPYGFLSDAGYDYFPMKSTDLKAWAEVLAEKTEAEFMATYGDYPIMVSKYWALRKAVEAKGIVFE